MNKTNLISNLGLCYAAKKMVLGTDNIVYGLKTKQVKLVVVSSLASFNTLKLIQNKCRSFNCEIMMIEEENYEILSKALGKNKIVAVGIKDKKFKEMMLRNI